MTGGGPGFSSDVLTSTIYKQYQAGFFGLATAGNVILFIGSGHHRLPDDAVLRPSRDRAMRAWRLFGRWWVDAAALLVLGIVFVVPFLFILLTAAMSQLQASRLDFVWPEEWRLVENLQEVLASAGRPDGHGAAEQLHPDRWLGAPHRGALRHDRIRPAATARSNRDRGQRLHARGTHHSSRCCPDDLRPPGARPVQDHPRADPGRGRLHHAFRRTRLPRFRGHHSRESSTRRRSSMAPHRCDSSGPSSSRCSAPP